MYPDHLEVLNSALLEAPVNVSSVYSDFVGAFYVPGPNNERHVLTRSLQVSRDFNRGFMFHFNHVLKVTAMHRTDRVKRVGGFHPDVRSLVEWSLHKKLAANYDMVRVERITGEYYVSVSKTDRVSSSSRYDRDDFDETRRKIITEHCPRFNNTTPQVLVVIPLIYHEQGLELLRHYIDNLNYPAHILLLDQQKNGSHPSYINPYHNVLYYRSDKATKDAISEYLQNSEFKYCYIASGQPNLNHPHTRIPSAIEFLESHDYDGVKWEHDEHPFLDSMVRVSTFLPKLDNDEPLRHRVFKSNVVSDSLKSDLLYRKIKEGNIEAPIEEILQTPGTVSVPYILFNTYKELIKTPYLYLSLMEDYPHHNQILAPLKGLCYNQLGHHELALDNLSSVLNQKFPPTYFNDPLTENLHLAVADSLYHTGKEVEALNHIMGFFGSYIAFSQTSELLANLKEHFYASS
jgi:hypothetical protein